MAMQGTEELITQWRIRVSRMKYAHYQAAIVFERMHLYFGIPVIILSTVVGTAVFASLDSSANADVQVAVGLLSMLAAVLASLQTFLRHSERAEKHRAAGARYGGLTVELEMLGIFPPGDPEQLRKRLAEFTMRWTRARDESPAIPERLWRRLAGEETQQQAIDFLQDPRELVSLGGEEQPRPTRATDARRDSA